MARTMRVPLQVYNRVAELVDKLGVSHGQALEMLIDPSSQTVPEMRERIEQVERTLQGMKVCDGCGVLHVRGECPVCGEQDGSQGKGR